MTLELASESDHFAASVDRTGDAVIIRLIGEFDVDGAPVVQQLLLEALQSTSPDVVCDLEHLTYLDSVGISVLVSARKRLTATGRTLVLKSPPDRVRKVLEISGVDTYFDIRTS